MRASRSASGSAVSTAADKPVRKRAKDCAASAPNSPLRIISTSRSTVAEKGDITAGFMPRVPNSHSAAPKRTLTATVLQRTQRESELILHRLPGQCVGVLPDADLDHAPLGNERSD